MTVECLAQSGTFTSALPPPQGSQNSSGKSSGKSQRVGQSAVNRCLLAIAFTNSTQHKMGWPAFQRDWERDT